jgi:hypothetical protein
MSKFAKVNSSNSTMENLYQRTALSPEEKALAKLEELNARREAFASNSINNSASEENYDFQSRMKASKYDSEMQGELKRVSSKAGFQRLDTIPKEGSVRRVETNKRSVRDMYDTTFSNGYDDYNLNDVGIWGDNLGSSRTNRQSKNYSRKPSIFSYNPDVLRELFVESFHQNLEEEISRGERTTRQSEASKRDEAFVNEKLNSNTLAGLSASDLMADEIRRVGNETYDSNRFGLIDDKMAQRRDDLAKRITSDRIDRNKKIARLETNEESIREWESMDRQRVRTAQDRFYDSPIMTEVYKNTR